MVVLIRELCPCASREKCSKSVFLAVGAYSRARAELRRTPDTGGGLRIDSTVAHVLIGISFVSLCQAEDSWILISVNISLTISRLTSNEYE
ncbi:MAG TPA: hypothetical protein VED16_00525 [Candidatus Acidoferrum sp.]|nr:hypothetical protein [Candidatus Acidoferrum sp.]